MLDTTDGWSLHDGAATVRSLSRLLAWPAVAGCANVPVCSDASFDPTAANVGITATRPCYFLATLPEPLTSETTKAPRERGFHPMELGGFEPPTSWVRSRRSPN